MARAKDVKAKEKKQKMILAGLGAVLLVVLAIELPGMLSSGGSPSASTTTDATTTTAATPSAGSPVPAATAPAGASVSSSEVVFTASVAKLSHLGFFKAKDPFDSHGAGATPAAASTPPAAAATPTPPPAAATESAAAQAAAAAAAAAGATSSGPIFGTIQGPSSPSGGSKPGAGAQSGGSSIPTAVIRFNGHRLTVALGQSFPKKNPYFRLAGVKPDGVMIAVLKGSLADGSASLELVKNTPLTLVNTASGGRFRIELLSGAKKKT